MTVFKITIRYVCACGSRWSRDVKTRVMVDMDRPFHAICPGCAAD